MKNGTVVVTGDIQNGILKRRSNDALGVSVDALKKAAEAHDINLVLLNSANSDQAIKAMLKQFNKTSFAETGLTT